MSKPVKRAVFTGSKPMQNPVKNPVSFYLVKKPVNFHSVFHRVENVKTCEKGSFHRDRTYTKPCEKPCEFLTCEKTCES